MDSTIEELLSIRAAELGCDREADHEQFFGCEVCDQYEHCLIKCYETAGMKPPSSEE